MITPQTPSGWRTDMANLSRSSDGTVWPYMRPPLARHEERHVDRFLDVAARLVEHLAHLARHVARERLLAVGDELRDAEQDLGAARRRHEPPFVVRARGRGNRALRVLRRRVLKESDQVGVVGGVAILEEAARRRRHPSAANEVVENRRRCVVWCGHVSLTVPQWNQQPQVQPGHTARDPCGCHIWPTPDPISEGVHNMPLTNGLRLSGARAPYQTRRGHTGGECANTGKVPSEQRDRCVAWILN